MPLRSHVSGKVPTLRRPFTSRMLRTSHHNMSTMPRPYRFHVCANWLAAPPEHGLKKRTTPFAPDTAIGLWRDHVLTSPRRGFSKTPGEDFFYVQEMRNQSGVSFGVADGVAGWALSGVDPSLFSQALMYHSHRYAKVGWPGEPEVDTTQDYEAREAVEGWELHPLECLKLAYQATLRERDIIAGSSTACLINLNASSGLLRAANLGDSGFMIIRSSAVFHRQRAQTHFFNCPRQLAKVPAILQGRSDRITDPPEAADIYETKLRDGDLIIAYTDGLSDNVFNHEITSICSLISRSGASENAQVQLTSDRIIEYARACMYNDRRTSPFEKMAAMNGKYHFTGGKPDDITLVVALVREVI
ncbi:phosphatase 2C-like domain-containing protein [Russula earlei]|uniref:Phosphatase 2C-like domain-containing protein n=1 Tax=Russula earlei TaxID=71964 RepID=A0ACC0UCB9_9AGAM|nr:phosphatase 2C-like domain-containing protein [Russula earlei]